MGVPRYNLLDTNYKCFCLNTSYLLFFIVVVVLLAQKVTKSESKCKYNVDGNNNRDDEKWLIARRTNYKLRSVTIHTFILIHDSHFFFFSRAIDIAAPYNVTHWITLFRCSLWMPFVMLAQKIALPCDNGPKSYKKQ